MQLRKKEKFWNSFRNLFIKSSCEINYLHAFLITIFFENILFLLHVCHVSVYNSSFASFSSTSLWIRSTIVELFNIFLIENYRFCAENLHRRVNENFYSQMRGQKDAKWCKKDEQKQWTVNGRVRKAKNTFHKK